MPNTAAGTPYVAPGDAVADYPATSKALADHIDAATDKMRGGSVVLTTDGVGIARIPNMTGYRIVSAMSGDSSAFVGIFVYDSAANFLPLNLSGQGVINKTMRINYVGVKE